jgi:molybdopterin-guanine dinucleotide biosynthesis protein A
MGEDKADLILEGRRLLDIAVETARAVTPQVRIVGSRERYGPEAIGDIYPGRGPLGGIHAALRQSAAEWNLMLAVDIPFVEPRFLRWMVEEARKSGATVTVPHVAGGYQPLCAVYRSGFGAVAETALQAGHNKIDALFSAVPLRAIDEDELRRFAFPATMFENLNTREDFDRASLRAREGK